MKLDHRTYRVELLELSAKLSIQHELNIKKKIKTKNIYIANEEIIFKKIKKIF